MASTSPPQLPIVQINNNQLDLQSTEDGFVAARFRNSYVPDGRDYFLKVAPNGDKIIAVVIPLYNEDWPGLFQTLKSLSEAVLPPGYRMIYMIIQDGWSKASTSMAQHFKRMFPCNLWDELKPSNKDLFPADESVTYIFQSEKNGFLAPTEIPAPPAKRGQPIQLSLNMEIVLVVKRDNRKKHNSHQWFFSEANGFCGFYQPEFCLATDCSTIFHPKCIKRMAKVLIRDDNCAVCTGRQVCMNAEQQDSEDSCIEWLFRQAQTYDFESSFSNFMGAFAIFGFLPVVPGPCGLYRWNLMKNDPNNPEHEGPLQWYFRIVNTAAEKCGLILANLKIAEDRILSYSAVLKTTRETTMQIAPDAEFYFEAETDLELFAKQRRRWINGTFAGYVYMMQNRDLIWDSEMALYRKLAVFFLILCQLGIYGIVFLTPAIFLSALYSVLFWIFPATTYDTTVPFALWIAYVVFYAWFMVAHTKNAYIGWSFYIHMALSMFTMVATFVGSIFYLVNANWAESNWISNLPITVTLAVMVAPLVISIVRPHSWLRSIKSVIPFYLFLPTLVAWFGCYSVARFFDITWGNRPVDNQQHGVVSAQDPAMKRVELQASTWTAFVLLANLILTMLCVVNDGSKYFIMTMALLVCSFSGVQITISANYFVFHHLVDKFVILPISWIIRQTLQKIYFGDYEKLLIESRVLPSVQEIDIFKTPAKKEDAEEEGYEEKLSVSHALMLSSPQFSINFSYQYIFQIVPVLLHSYHVESDQDNALLNLAFPVMGLILFMLMGRLGDKYARGNEKSPFRKIAAVGVGLYIIVTITLEFVRNHHIADLSHKYWMLKSQTYIQGLFLNVLEAAYLVLFLTHAPNSKLLFYVGLKAFMGTIGNLVSSIISVSDYSSKVDHELMEKGTAVVSCLLLALTSVLTWIATNKMPKDRARPQKEDSDSEEEQQPINAGGSEKGWTEKRIRRVAIVLATFFFFSAALAPIQFGLADLFNKTWSEDKAFKWSEGTFIGQEALTLLAGLIIFCAKTGSLKHITVVLSLTSVAQLLLFSSQVSSNDYFVMAIVMWCGLYRAVPEVYCYYFFAKEVQQDNMDGSNDRIGFWVASMNVTLVLAQIIGYPLVGSLVLLALPFHYLFGFAGLFNLFGIATAWRIHHSTRQDERNDKRLTEITVSNVNY